ncbi:MAG: acetylglutamate kinase [Bdellovibrionales bacterium]|nr:acetylglutamate kinase [Bdellovibrionales bacterium]
MKRVLIKLGGAALESQATLKEVTQLIQDYRARGISVVMVHGGGPSINTELRLRGIQWTFVGGQRVTTSAMMDVIESTLCGNVNHNVVSHFNSHGVPAVGFAGTDRQMLLCEQASLELGQVGKIVTVNANWLNELISVDQPVPVVAPLGVGANGQRFNINADWAASHLAVALKVDRLLFLTDQFGIMDEEGLKIPSVDAQGLRNMIECKVVSGGMLTKALAILNALENGVAAVSVSKAQDPDSGTQCMLRSQKEEVCVEL